MKKILVDATPLQSEHRLRGVGHYLHSLLATNAFARSDAWYLLSHFEPSALKLTLPSQQSIRLPRPHKPAQVYWLYNELALRTALLSKRPKVLFAPDFNGLVANPFGSTVAVLHDLTALKLEPTANPNLSEHLSNLRWSAYYAKLKRTKRLIVISESVKQDAIKLLNLGPERLEVVHHGVNHELFRPSVGKGAYAAHPPYFVNLGARNTNKNQARLLEAFSLVARTHPDVTLFFAGPWGPADLKWLEDARLSLSLGDRVRHLGYVPDKDLPSLYGNALAFVFPSLEEGFGMPILEAMACGAPVITSNQGALAEVAQDAALLVDPRSVADLANAMERVLKRASLRTSLRDKGFEHASSFTWEGAAQKTLEILLRAGEPCT